MSNRLRKKANGATKMTKPKAVVRTTRGLQDVLFDEIDELRSGKSNPTRANAIGKLAPEASTQSRAARSDQEGRMNLSRRGLFGFLGGGAAAAVTPPSQTVTASTVLDIGTASPGAKLDVLDVLGSSRVVAADVGETFGFDWDEHEKVFEAFLKREGW